MRFMGRVQWVALAGIIGMAVYGCSSATSPQAPGGTLGGNAGDAGHPGTGSNNGNGNGDAAAGAPGSGTPGPGTTTADGTVGKTCTTNADCDVTGQKVTVCSNDEFTAGTVLPTPVCVGTTCNPGDGTQLVACDNGNGVCLALAKGAICMPACSFGNDAKAAVGCTGKDTCNALGFGTNAQGALEGGGYCFGGCTADADCTGGDKCDAILGVCVKAPPTRTKKLGDACTDQDGTACDCIFTAQTKKGYCTQYCTAGAATACPTGFTCSAGLPKVQGDGGTAFSQQPPGLAGSCLKSCTTDADCTALNARCDKTDAAGNVCVPL